MAVKGIGFAARLGRDLLVPIGVMWAMLVRDEETVRKTVERGGASMYQWALLLWIMMLLGTGIELWIFISSASGSTLYVFQKASRLELAAVAAPFLLTLLGIPLTIGLVAYVSRRSRRLSVFQKQVAEQALASMFAWSIVASMLVTLSHSVWVVHLAKDARDPHILALFAVTAAASALFGGLVWMRQEAVRFSNRVATLRDRIATAVMCTSVVMIGAMGLLYASAYPAWSTLAALEMEYSQAAETTPVNADIMSCNADGPSIYCGLLIMPKRVQHLRLFGDFQLNFIERSTDKASKPIVAAVWAPQEAPYKITQVSPGVPNSLVLRMRKEEACGLRGKVSEKFRAELAIMGAGDRSGAVMLYFPIGVLHPLPDLLSQQCA